MRTSAALLALATAASAFKPQHQDQPGWFDSHPIVPTTSGRIHGKVDPDLPNVAQYLGIPYAVPPVGPLRWTAPQMLDQPHAQINATELPADCMQWLSTTATWVHTGVLEFNPRGLNHTGPISEDCLTLSVYTPTAALQRDGWLRRHHGRIAESGSGLPVIIHVYGGGFYSNGMDVPYLIPAQWVNRTANHIVVMFNYRMNIFGHPNAAGLEEQNFGLLDQRAVVEWCQTNIAAFGGDPNKIILWGQSSGAMSIDYYSFAHPSDLIISGMILHSGTALTPFLVDDHTHSNFTFVAENVGCSGLADAPEQQLACMRGIDANKIESFIGAYTDTGTAPYLAFTPVMDDRLVFHNYTERAVAGLQADIPAIVGTNTQDGVPFAPYDANNVPDPTIAFSVLLSLFFCPTTETIRLRQQTGRITYRYLYAGNFSNISPLPYMGASHGNELPLLMGTHSNYRSPSTPLEDETSRAWQDAYVAFANDPMNGLPSQDWQPYTQLGVKQVREFGDMVAAKVISVAGMEALCDGAAPAS